MSGESNSAAPRIDLSRLAGEVRATADDWISRGVAGNAVMKHFADQLEAVLIDASPKGGSTDALDAARYRWLRDRYDPSVHDDDGDSIMARAGEKLDAAIDAAMQATSAEVLS